MKKALVSGALLAVAMSGAQAVTYSNTVLPNDNIGTFGYSSTPTYGQTFSLSAASVLQDWTFYGDGYPSVGSNLRFVVANWDAVGERALSELYSAPGTWASMPSGTPWASTAIQFSGINLTLAAGNYIAYVTTSNVTSDPVNGGSFQASLTGGASAAGDALGGRFYYAQTGNNMDPLAAYSQTGVNPWFTYFIGDDDNIAHLRLTANFDPVSVAGPLAPVSAVPEPSAYAMMLLGLCGVGLMARRRKAVAI